MVKEQLKRIIVENQERMPFRLFKRHAATLVDTRQIHAVVGLRRVGKTHFLYQAANELLERGVPREALVLVNFEDERLAGLTGERLGLVLEAYYELYPDRVGDEVHLFFDEIQTVPGWERFVARLFEEKRHRIRVTGSSSKLLGKEIATALRGRAVTTNLYPLSFREYAEYRGVDVTERLPYSQERFKAVKLLEEYLAWGGFFEVVDAADDAERRRIVSTYLDLVVYKDLVERYGVKNLAVLKAMIRHYVANTTRKTSLARLGGTIREATAVSKNTVGQYTALLEDAGFLHVLPKFSYRLSRNAVSKYYVADPVFKTVAGHSFSPDTGALYEQAVLLELVRRGGDRFFFDEQAECDFIVKQGTKVVDAIQVCVDPEAARERELRGLVTAMHALRLRKGTVVSASYEAEETIEGKAVRYVPLWRWLLETH